MSKVTYIQSFVTDLNKNLKYAFDSTVILSGNQIHRTNPLNDKIWSLEAFSQ